MWFRTALKTITLIAAVCGTASCARDQNTPGGTGRSLDHVIVEIEAGRATTPLVAQPVPGSETTVTFLVKSDDGEVPRIVSDVTGWGEAPDDSSFDLGIGTMTRINATPWYRLDTVVAPEARIEYLVVHGETDYQVDPNNPRRGWARGRHDISELVTPDYQPPPELTDPPVTPGGTTVEAILDSQALGLIRRVLVYLPFGRTRLWDRVAGRELPEWAGEIGVESWAQFFLKYAVAHPAVTAVTPSTSKPKHMLDNLGAGMGELPDQAMQQRMADLVDALPAA